MPRPRLVVAAFLALVCTAAPASAQSLGIGPRFAFVRGDIPTATPSTSFLGGTVRLPGSSHHAFEMSLDIRTGYNDARTERTRETPLQVSMLIYPVRKVFAPYVVGGIGFYRRTIDLVDANGLTLSSTRDQKHGFHLGGGMEIFLTRHAAVYADYRFRFVRLGLPGEGEEPINIPGVDSVKLAYRGTMWTSGMAFYF